MIYQLKPVFINKLWGGDYYSTLYHLDNHKIGEVVLFSTHIDYPLTTLTENIETLLKEFHPELYQQVLSYFPITIKLIDAKDDLFIQVHPDNTYAHKHHQTIGKEEYWMILEALPTSSILIGHSAKDQHTLKEIVLNEKLNHYMNHYPIKQGDIFYISANTVHAIQKHTRLLEIAQASILIELMIMLVKMKTVSFVNSTFKKQLKSCQSVIKTYKKHSPNIFLLTTSSTLNIIKILH